MVFNNFQWFWKKFKVRNEEKRNCAKDSPQNSKVLNKQTIFRSGIDLCGNKQHEEKNLGFDLTKCFFLGGPSQVRWAFSICIVAGGGVPWLGVHFTKHGRAIWPVFWLRHSVWRGICLFAILKLLLPSSFISSNGGRRLWRNAR